jgi:hypothetical protein
MLGPSSVRGRTYILKYYCRDVLSFHYSTFKHLVQYSCKNIETRNCHTMRQFLVGLYWGLHLEVQQTWYLLYRLLLCYLFEGYHPVSSKITATNRV